METPKTYRKAVPHTFNFVVFGEDGPEEREEKRWFMFSMYAYEQMFVAMGIDPTKHTEKELARIAGEMETSELHSMSLMIYAGLLEHSRQVDPTPRS